MCTVILSPGVNPIAVNTYITSYQIRNKRRGLLSKIVLLHRHNVRPHAAAGKLETSNLGFCQIQTSHQATFMPSDRPLHGLRFGSDEAVNEAVHTWTREPKTRFSDGIRKVVQGYTKFEQLQGDYVEK